ncbi:unnamed protein product [Rhizopus stolonifer]
MCHTFQETGPEVLCCRGCYFDDTSVSQYNRPPEKVLLVFLSPFKQSNKSIIFIQTNQLLISIYSNKEIISIQTKKLSLFKQRNYLYSNKAIISIQTKQLSISKYLFIQTNKLNK